MKSKKKNQFENSAHKIKKIRTLQKYTNGDYSLSPETKGEIAHGKNKKQFFLGAIVANDLTEDYVKSSDIKSI